MEMIHKAKQYLRQLQYVGVFAFFCVTSMTIQNVLWTSNSEIHLILEVCATTIAGLIAFFALIRYHTSDDDVYLLIGAGFLAATVFDVFHVLAGSSFLALFFTREPISFSHWTWNASRIFLGIMFCVAYVSLRYGNRGAEKKRLQPRWVYLFVTSITVVSIFLLTTRMLPRSYYPEFVYGRPFELISALFFLIAIVGFFQLKRWQERAFDHSIMLSLVVAFSAQSLFIVFSKHIFDPPFIIATVARLISYLCLLGGLFADMYLSFRDVSHARAILEEQNTQLSLAKKQAEESNEIARKRQHQAEKILRKLQKTQDDFIKKSWETEKLNKAMVGRELRMAQLKDENRLLKKRLAQENDQ